jgi:hypothetical protein
MDLIGEQMLKNYSHKFWNGEANYFLYNLFFIKSTRQKSIKFSISPRT